MIMYFVITTYMAFIYFKHFLNILKLFLHVIIVSFKDIFWGILLEDNKSVRFGSQFQVVFKNYLLN